MKTHKKITTGFVVQEYKELPNGSFVCVGQEFVAVLVDYENDMGDAVEVDTSKEKYCTYDMVQPKPVPA